MLNNPTLQFISNHLTFILYGSYVFVLVFLSTLEYLIPRRLPQHSRFRRWVSNLSIYLIDQLILRSLATVVITNLAYFTWKNGWGLLNHLPLSPWAQLIISLLLLDLMGYAFHVLYHKVPWGWRFHRVHHLEMDLDSTSGLLFHPFESLVSFLVRQPFVLLIGPAPLAVFLFDSMVVIADLLTHANIRVHPALDRILRWVFVTPDMHRIHHSTNRDESNSNYGFSTSLWDRLFRTYLPQAGLAQERMELGLKEFQPAQSFGLLRLLAFPFLGKKEVPFEGKDSLRPRSQ